MVSTLTPVEIAVGQVMKSSIPVNCLLGSKHSCCVASVHFQLPNRRLRLQVHAPLPVPCWPPVEGPEWSERDLPSWWTAVGLSTLQSCGPHPFSAANYSLVSSSLNVHVSGPRLLLWAIKMVGLSGELVRAQLVVVLLSVPCQAVRGRHLCPRPDCNVPGSLHHIVCAGSLNDVSAGRRTAC